jgi:hypothetical protein
MERGKPQFLLWFDLLIFCAVVAVMIGGLVVRIRMPIAPLADGDTWGYLRPALSWLSGLGFQQTYARDWLYPALLAGILKISGDFCAITYAQRFLGMIGIPMFLLVWWSWLRLLPPQSPLWRRVSCMVALLFLAFYALSPHQALLEDTIRPEGVLAVFEMVYLYCLISFFDARWRLRRTGWAIAFGAAALGLSYAVLLLKPSWGFSLGVTFLFVAAGSFGGATRLTRFGPLLAGTIVIVFVFFLPKLLGFQKDAASHLFLPQTLVCIHAAQVLEASPSDASLNGNPVQRALYEELAEAFRIAKEKLGRYHSLGFDSDYIQYSSGFSRRFAADGPEESAKVRELASTCYSAYFRAWLHAPRSMLQKIGRQIRIFLFPRAGDFYSTGKSVDLNHETAVSRPFLPASALSPDVQKIYQAYQESLEKIVTNPSHPLGFQILAKLALYLAWISFWLQLAFFVAMVGLCLNWRGRNWRLAGFVVVAVLAATYGNVLTIAVVHSLDVVRYRISYAPGFLLGLAMIVTYLITLAFGWRKLGEQVRTSVAAKTNPELGSVPQ